MSLSAPSSLGLDDYKAMAQSPDVAQRAVVAMDEAAPPEILYYLSDDQDVGVRTASADNISTPMQAMERQSRDQSHQVRAALARKIGRILPQMQGEKSRPQVMATLEQLVMDKADEVRLAVVRSLADTAFLPPKLALALAQDSVHEIATPVLRFCLSLSDEDLIGLVKKAQPVWVPVEVAQRKDLSNSVALAIWESGNSDAATALLGNYGTSLAPVVIDEATEAAVVETQLQKPLVHRPELTPMQMDRLAEFVDGSLLQVLAERAGVDRGTLSDTSTVIRRRLDWAEWRKQSRHTEQQRAIELHRQGQLDSVAISDAIAWGERHFVVQGLALLAQTSPEMVEKILAHQSPKGITALCFKAKVTMRVCRLVQLRIARVPVMKALYAKEGVGYPLSAEEITWQLEFYGVVQG
jgi:uncharacterized protein (DUF2336 family)